MSHVQMNGRTLSSVADSVERGFSSVSIGVFVRLAGSPRHLDIITGDRRKEKKRKRHVYTTAASGQDIPSESYTYNKKAAGSPEASA
jgi:hypothetical protein